MANSLTSRLGLDQNSVRELKWKLTRTLLEVCASLCLLEVCGLLALQQRRGMGR